MSTLTKSRKTNKLESTKRLNKSGEDIINSNISQYQSQSLFNPELLTKRSVIIVDFIHYQKTILHFFIIYQVWQVIVVHL